MPTRKLMQLRDECEAVISNVWARRYYLWHVEVLDICQHSLRLLNLRLIVQRWLQQVQCCLLFEFKPTQKRRNEWGGLPVQPYTRHCNARHRGRPSEASLCTPEAWPTSRSCLEALHHQGLQK